MPEHNKPARQTKTPLSALLWVLLHLEGAAVLTSCVALYFHVGGGWAVFLLLVLVPNLYMVGYAANPRIGGLLYNIAPTYVLPIWARRSLPSLPGFLCVV